MDLEHSKVTGGLVFFVYTLYTLWVGTNRDFDQIYLHTWDNVTEANGEHGDEGEIEGVEEGKILFKGTETRDLKDQFPSHPPPHIKPDKK